MRACSWCIVVLTTPTNTAISHAPKAPPQYAHRTALSLVAGTERTKEPTQAASTASKTSNPNVPRSAAVLM